MKTLLIISLFFFIPICGFSQLGRKINPNQFEFELYNGGSFASVYKHIVKDFSPRGALGLDHRISLSLNRLLNEHLSISLDYGFGFQAVNYTIPSTNSHSVNENYNYWHKAKYNLYHKGGVKANYYLQVTREDRLRFGLGAGFLQFFSSGNTIVNSGISEIKYILRMDYSGDIVPVVNMSLDYLKPLKNKNEIRFGLSYMHGFIDVMTGSYIINTYPNSGLLNSNASSFGANIAYVLTGNHQYENYKTRVEAGENPKTIKRECRQERRSLSPKSTFINIQYGGLITVNKVNDPGGYYGKAGSGGYYIGIEYEHGIKNNFVLTSEFYLSEYWNARRMTATGWSAGSNGFVAHDLSIGGAYRLITNSNYKLANFYAGLMGGYCSKPKGLSYAFFGSNSIISFDDDGIMRISEIDIDGERQIVSRFLIGAYLGVSKDFRITDFVWLSLNYRYQLGFNDIEISNFEYSTNEFEGVNYAQSRIDGTAHRIGAGLKLRFK